MTMIDTLSDQHYKSREKLAWEFATILNEEARELEAAGVDVIQFDEPAFTVFHDEVQDWGVAATLERGCGPPGGCSGTGVTFRSTGRPDDKLQGLEYGDSSQ
ncbi:hypothetical protein BIU97_08205 [Curtobacterium sp. MCBA15_009]|nr:hypothetical protein BIU97_08205 [Curtobacterium sp. MCBA15_009]